MPGPPDDDLYRRLRSGDEPAFTELYGRWQGPLYRFALRMSGQPTLAEDVVHEVFMTLIRGQAGYDPQRGPLGAYLYGVARHQLPAGRAPALTTNLTWPAPAMATAHSSVRRRRS